ncbi:MAG TPA: hypothetical protein PLL69_09015 [Gemmatimonadales bacterium]|nr:hypothetical protein [Gemmatimonadales bacterium]
MTIQSPLRVALVSLVLVACGPGDETGLPHGVTAVAGGDTLMETDLEELLSRSPDLPDLDDARSIVSTWINLALLKSAMANDPDLSSYRDRATETVVGELAVIQFAEAAGRNSRAATDAEIDSVIRMNAVRTFDSYSIPVASPSDTASIASAVETVESLRRSAATLDSPSQAYDQLPAGVRQRFDLVRLGAVSRGELPPALAEELWKLKVGDISPVMAGPGGVQFFVRRSSSDFRPLVADWLRPRIRAANDAVTVDSIINASGLKASADGVARLRAGMHEPGTISGSGPLATWNGGELTPEIALKGRAHHYFMAASVALLAAVAVACGGSAASHRTTAQRWLRGRTP